jgi:hypothetical protein
VPEGEYKDITLFDGSTLRLETISGDHNPSDAVAALGQIHQAEQDQRHVTGLLYYNPEPKTHDEMLELCDTPLAELTNEQLRPSEADLADLLADFRA